MLRILLACLLTTTAFLQVQGHTGQAKAVGANASNTRPQHTGKAVPQTMAFQKAWAVGRLYLSSSSPEVLSDWSLAAAPDAGQPDATDELPTADFKPDAIEVPAALAITLRRPAAPMGARRFRTRLVRLGRWATHREALEILTCTDHGPLVLAQLPGANGTPNQLLAGAGYDLTTPLRPLELTQAAVLRLCGDRAPQVRAYAMIYDLHFQQAAEVARMLDYFNRIAVVKE